MDEAQVDPRDQRRDRAAGTCLELSTTTGGPADPG